MPPDLRCPRPLASLRGYRLLLGSLGLAVATRRQPVLPLDYAALLDAFFLERRIKNRRPAGN